MELEDKKVEDLVKVVFAKLDAKDRDKEGLLGVDTDFTPDELLVYKWLMLNTDKDIKRFVDAKYLNDTVRTNKDIGEYLGISVRSVFYIRRRMLDGLRDYLNQGELV